MPYSKKSKYKHLRQEPPSKFLPTSFKTVPISHVPHRKKYPKGTKAIVGKTKLGKWDTQSILVPKRKR